MAMTEVDNGLVLVIAGGGDSIVFSSGVQLDNNRYIQAGYVSDGELKSLYKNATCFAQASTSEGFGLPLVEAMARGTPIVCSSAASLPEVCSNAAIYFDPQSPSDIARAINEVIRDEDLKKHLISAGSVRAAHYDWDVSAKELIDHILTKSKNSNPGN
jgi:glycosyltransferase involved in cell wall biosynthesis